MLIVDLLIYTCRFLVKTILFESVDKWVFLTERVCLMTSLTISFIISLKPFTLLRLLKLATSNLDLIKVKKVSGIFLVLKVNYERAHILFLLKLTH